MIAHTGEKPFMCTDLSPVIQATWEASVLEWFEVERSQLGSMMALGLHYGDKVKNVVSGNTGSQLKKWKPEITSRLLLPSRAQVQDSRT
jgi:hypothetical protein